MLPSVLVKMLAVSIVQDDEASTSGSNGASSSGGQAGDFKQAEVSSACGVAAFQRMLCDTLHCCVSGKGST